MVTSLKHVSELGCADREPSIIIFTYLLLHLNKSSIKELKKIIGYNSDTPELKKHFKRLKKQYSSLSTAAKPIFLDKLRKIYDN